MKRKFKEVEKEFPSDTALQQIHIARKILQEEAKKKEKGALGIYKVRS